MELQEDCMDVLNNATFKNWQAQTVVVEANDLEVILAAIRKLPSKNSLQETGLICLYSIVYENKLNAELFVNKLDGVPFVIKAMKRFPKK